MRRKVVHLDVDLDRRDVVGAMRHQADAVAIGVLKQLRGAQTWARDMQRAVAGCAGTFECVTAVVELQH